MKHMKKILSFLLSAAIAFTMLPAMALADDGQSNTVQQPSVTLGTTKLNRVLLEQGTPSAYVVDAPQYDGAVEKKLNESGQDKVLPVYSYNGYVYTPVNYGVPKEKSVVLSNPGVIDNCSFSLQWGLVSNGKSYPCLAFEYRGAKAGTTKVTLTFFYNFGLTGISGGRNWHQKTVTFNVTVSDEEIAKPEKPTTSDLKNFRNYVNSTSSSEGAVYLWCNNYDHHAWFDYVTEVEGGYSLGDVVANDGSSTKAPAAKYPWMCEMTINAQAYLDAYNHECSGDWGTHYLAEEEPATQTVKWYSDGSKWYYLASDAPVYIDITHTAPVTEYTVTYTDGVDDETVFADQSYTVKSGDPTPAFQIEGVPAVPSRDGYVFLGWTPEIADTVTGNVTYTAQWEEKLTDVTLKSSIREGSLLFLNNEFTVTVTANTAANIDLNAVAMKGEPFEQVGEKQVSEDGKTATFTYRVKQITAAYTKLTFTATATKGTQEPVTGSLSLGVNLRNRIHVTLKRMMDNSVIDNATVVLNHPYPQWNKCPKLTFKNGEYRANDWDISNQPFSSVTIQLNGQEYSISKDVKGRDLSTLFSAGTEEVYVEYVVVDPINVEIIVDGVSVGHQAYQGTAGETLNYSQQLNSAIQNIIAGGRTILSLTTEGLTDGTATFGHCTNVTVSITTAVN
ncbi:hypothetical protein [Dysosmobacter sp. HCP28S3_G4]|uniref:hypothetical protein n=1 Tax=Dysosmobacter sp. HCP28S3_G4 TaxID=3438938 RepID=UPI003F8B388E